ncbi:NADP-dependent phosphogluconate dehydrogenase [Ligilactobacillus ceti]|uniref:6-phosphogluconate dehydrogenase, decarboxylating n=1 Tax=Ligilactobacillus ceti DSM 22408 TaxID=1122146 RepID=A0A0R2KHW9_9LACO|nr:NADP-dependent phosphogluconate dehydrogenase [Ligilactobacillus ceti]KRN88910.1 6-phosphogluconate dehydrogenase [Ligilactobacillus ceti DSM 22408]
MSKAQIGVIGMAVMGKNLALNIESRGYTVAIYNRTGSKTEQVVAENPDKKLIPSYSLADFVASLEKPRKIILMVKAGMPTDAMISNLLPYLDQDDILIDGGNTYFEDTIRRNKELENSGINFIGMGVSGGEKGALHGPSLMPGGQRAAYDLVAPILQEIAALAVDGDACVSYIGPDGAGHYVKMVHNGIEYGDMELIAESYSLLRNVLGLTVSEIAEVFNEWKQSELSSYLIDITADILTRKDDLDTDQPIVDVILDRAGNKGTGKWSSQSALELGVPQSLITESVYARYISALKDERMAASEILPKPTTKDIKIDKDLYIKKIKEALYFSKVMSYAQGFEQLRVASEHYGWDLQYGELAKIWREGCIIRAQFLQKITDAFETNPELKNLLLDPYFVQITKEYQQSVRDVSALAIQLGEPCPGFTSAITYYDQYRAPVLPANMIQAQRDYFGAHTYERVDKEGNYHYSWYDEE